ncbi:MAG: hypothetical protein Q8922_06530 [Bacteroidota bacterium]|nr:hypothetical protein [Bacteroidota bacterium]MDP4232749.1 hypothetical protein [Bacteroidota bacterium]MDP4244065.1 hypothetical protein [Bacteroidota bacterium]MDP4287575.1 hypothetical protein [Bacteroidota bacterium]
MRIATLSVVHIVLLLNAVGCQQSDTSTQSNVPSTARHAPGPESIFYGKHWYTFANAPAVGPDTFTRTVTARGMSFEGKDNVTFYVQQSGTAASHGYVSYESNGDVSNYAGPSVGWERIPLSSKDIVVCIKGKNSLGNLVVDTNSFIEAKDTTIEGHFWHAIKIRQIISLDGHVYDNAVLWYDAETGWYLRMDLPPRHPFEAGLSANGEEVHVYDCKIIP